MDINELIDKLYSEFDDIPAGSLSPETEFSSIENWGSMHALIIIALVDTEYDITLTGADLKTMKSISDLYNLIITRKS